jgi:amidohydrolase
MAVRLPRRGAPVVDALRQEIVDLREEMVALRREFHRFPELGMEERRTAETVAGRLSDLGLDVRTGIGQTGVVGLLEGDNPGKTILLRADMDALPIQEMHDFPHRSQNPGVMHACGHDGHMAILLTVAKLLATRRAHIRGRVKFVFQPGEEGMGGARFMIRDGVLKEPGVDAAFALHLIAQMPVGLIGLRTGPLMASMDSFTIRITGKGGHAAMPEGGVDAIFMTAQAITALQGLITREVSPLTPLVVHVGTIHGGEAFNIVAERVEMKGTVRTLDEMLRRSIPARMDRILKGATSALRGTHDLQYDFGYPPVVNNRAMADVVRTAAAQVVGTEKVIELPATMASDDMAFFLEKVPGCYFFVGAGEPGEGISQPHHNARFDIDEESLVVGAETLGRVALTYLQSS